MCAALCAHNWVDVEEVMSEFMNHHSVTDQGRYRAARAAKNVMNQPVDGEDDFMSRLVDKSSNIQFGDLVKSECCFKSASIL